MATRKKSEGTRITFRPGVKEILDMVAGLTGKPRTQYIADLIDADIVNRLSGIENINEVLESLQPGLSKHFKQIKARVNSSKLPPTTTSQPSPDGSISRTTTQTPTPAGYIGTEPSSFQFQGKEYEVSTWQDLLLQVCRILYNRHRDDFLDTTHSYNGHRRRTYFSTNESDARGTGEWHMEKPCCIPGIDTNIWVETGWNADYTVQICRELMEQFGYQNDDLKIFT